MALPTTTWPAGTLPRITHLTHRVVVQAPSGPTPAAGVWSTYRYRHHTAIERVDGVWYRTWTAGVSDEDGDGQVVLCQTSTDFSPTAPAAGSWSAPFTLADPQSDFQTNPPGQTNSRVWYPSGIYTAGGKTYAALSLVEWASPTSRQRQALVVQEITAAGRVGTPKRISAASYTPRTGYAEIVYDAALESLLRPTVDLYAQWTGTSLTAGGKEYVEPTTVYHPGLAKHLRLWRSTTTTGSAHQWLHLQESEDGGSTWSPATPQQTAIPNYPSAPKLALWGNRAVLLVSGLNQGFGRYMLKAVAPDNSLDFAAGEVRSVWAGDQGNPAYPGAYAHTQGRGQYPGLAIDGDTAVMMGSRHKEQAELYVAPVLGATLPSLPAGLPTVARDLGARWHVRLDETSGTVAEDLYKLRPGTILNGVQLGQPGLTDDGNAAMRFDGVDDSINFGPILDPGSDSYTMVVMFRTPNPGSGARRLIGRGNRYSTHGGWSLTYNEGLLSARVNVGDSTTARASRSVTVPVDDQRHMVAIVVDRVAGRVRVYADGSSLGSSSGGGGPSTDSLAGIGNITTTNGSLGIGAAYRDGGAHDHYAGLVDEAVCLPGVALNDEQMATLYEAATTVPGVLDPALLKPSMTTPDGLSLKPSLIRKGSGYITGPATSDQLKSGLLDKGGNLKPSMLDERGEPKPKLRG